RRELREGLTHLGCALTPNEFDTLVRLADADGDGVINYRELSTLVETQRATYEKADETRRQKQDDAGNYPIHFQTSEVFKPDYMPPPQ
ncbi:unnamed protein product, partial [Heterosigma akashiwo]